MAIFRRNKIAIIIITLLLLTSCRSKKIVTSTQQEKDRQETVVIQAPYKFSIVEEITVDSEGQIKPLEMRLKFNETEGIVTIKDGIAEFSVENPDTLVVSREVVEKEKIEKVTETTIEPSGLLSWWRKFKNSILIGSLIINVFFVAYTIYRIKKKIPII